MDEIRFSRRAGLAGAVAGGLTLAGAGTLTGTAASATEVHWTDDLDELTLFAFDQVSIPSVQNLKLEMRDPVKHPANPVVPRGEAGAPDSWAVQFYGSVIKVGDVYRMWYCAVSAEERAEHTGGSTSALWRVAYAESTDGVTWTKPDLGLVEFRGSTHNNLVRMDPPIGVLNLKVLYEPDDDPSRRYKMGCHVYWQNKGNRHGTLAVYASPDGLTWTSLTDIAPVEAEMVPDELLLPAFHAEPVGGLYNWKGTYYASGQNGIGAVRPIHGRAGRTWESGDFTTWQQTSTLTWIRHQQHTLLGPGRSLDGEQQHEGVSVWNRGNVLLGVVGRWHGDMSWQNVTIDLGFLVSNDGMAFREPAHEWTFIPRGGDGAPAELVANASFETLDGDGWPTPWTLDANRGQTAAASTGRARTGSTSLRVENVAGTSIGVRTPKLPAAEGVEYTASMWALTESGTPAQLYVDFYDDGGRRLANHFVQPEPSADWAEVTLSATAPAGTATLDVMIYGSTAAVGVSFHDDVAVSRPGAGEGEPEWDRGGVIQGQGFENVGDETFVYYGAWDPRVNIPGVPLPPRGGVGIAVLPKDRFGDLTVDLRGEGSGDYQIPEVTSEFITATIVLGARHRRPKFHVNAEGLGDGATLRFELLEHDFTPIPGYSGADAAVVATDGFRAPLSWGRGRLPEKVRIRGFFDGEQNTSIKLSAIYVD
ncbi:carbohydrate binding domain-containing protein [Jiangella muralis]|uniref:carbohydrate binding domain-containing protein n=1 Tax=Jiangella muralis TaxID=702383 RepID=UPI00069D7A4A|nr:carbohydrate binding domain-containing protein [Jiangella muralis]